jgi:hypothetical protein
MLDALHKQSDAALRNLTAALRSGPLAQNPSRTAFAAFLGSDDASLWQSLSHLQSEGFAPPQIATLCDSILRARTRADDLGRQLDLIVSGPDTPGTPTGDTAAAMHALIAEARREVLIVGYAVHQGRRLFAPLAERMREIPDLHVVFCLNIIRNWGDKTRADQLATRFVTEFYTKHWPWAARPVLRYDPRSLSMEAAERASLHAKCVIIDRATALVTSANLTEAAQQRNIEVGILVRDPALAARLANYFDELFALGVLHELA